MYTDLSHKQWPVSCTLKCIVYTDLYQEIGTEQQQLNNFNNINRQNRQIWENLLSKGNLLQQN